MDYDFLIDRLKRCAFQGINPGIATMTEAADKLSEAQDLIRLAIYMRQRQRKYFKDRTADSLVGAKQAETKFDKLIQEINGRD